MTSSMHRNSHVHVQKGAHRAHGSAPKKTSYTDAFLAAHALEAKKVAEKYDLPASAILAQSAIESHWGLKAPGNAYFGIKGKASDGESRLIATHEVIAGKRVAETDAFRAYASWADAADDYGNLITTNTAYASVLPYRRDAIKYSEAISHSPYATDPAYGELMKKIIKQHNLTQYDK